MIDVRIDPEFQNKIPSMPEDVFLGLRDDILRDGYVRDPLVVWKEENILLDGHHRWKVIKENEELLGDKFTVDYKSFPNRWACIDWICANQLHKHNMTEAQREVLIGQMYKARKKSAGGQAGNDNAKEKRCVQNAHVVSERTQRTNEIIGKELGINPSTVTRAEHFADGVEILRDISPVAADKVLNGEANVTKLTIRSLPNLDKETQKVVASKIERGDTVQIEKKDSSSTILEKKNLGGSAKTRATFAAIDAAYESFSENAASKFTVDDLAEEIKANGADFVASLRRIIASRSELLNEDGAREKARLAVDEVINSITALRGLI